MWTEERLAELVKLKAQGLSSSRIAYRLGSVTRNAVIGKLHRMGLTTPRAARAAKRVVRRFTRAAPRVSVARQVLLRQPALPTEALPDPRRPLPSARLLAIGETEAHHCRYIHDTSTGPRCCSTTTVPGTSWCEAHLRIVYQPLTEQWRERSERFVSAALEAA